MIFFDDTIFWKRKFTLVFFTDRSWRIKFNSVTYDILRGRSHFLNSIRFAIFRTFYQYPFVRYIAILDHILNDSFLISYILYMFFSLHGFREHYHKIDLHFRFVAILQYKRPYSNLCRVTTLLKKRSNIPSSCPSK